LTGGLFRLIYTQADAREITRIRWKLKHKLAAMFGT
jgi:hypothetical protein